MILLILLMEHKSCGYIIRPYHVETIALLSKKNLKPKDYVEISADAKDYYRIKDAKK